MKTFKFTLLLLFIISTAYGQNSLTIKDLEAGPGDSAKIIVELDNTEEVSGLQFKIKVPNNLIVDIKESQFVGRSTDHVIYPKALGNGEYLILAFSGSNSNFTGQAGDLIEIPVEIPLTYIVGESYDMIFTEVILSSSSSEDIGSNHSDGTLNIIEGKTPDLEVSNIAALQNDILPDGPCNISWNVQNIGLTAAVGGWREQIILVSQTDEKRYIIGNTSYTSDLLENESITREIEVNIPSIIGFDGGVNIEVVLTTNYGVKEPTSKKENNTSISSATNNLLKRLIFTLDKTEIAENSTESIRIKLARSGNTDTEENFTISADLDNAFSLPANLKINADASSSFLYIEPIDNDTYLGDTPVELIASGNSYVDESATLNLLDDENVILTLDYPDNYETTIGSEITFTLTANFSVTEDKTILLSTDQSERLQLPSQVILPANSKTVTFNGTIIDSQNIEKAEVANVFAKAEGYTTGIIDLMLDPTNIPSFTLEINPNEISEGQGIKATYATLKRTTQIDKSVTVQISTNIEDKLILPNDILFQEGESEKIFNIGAVDNSIVEGDIVVSVMSHIMFDGCSCIDNSDTSTFVSADITMLDNDGLALTVKTSPSTIKAGTANNKLTITRNTNDPTILQNAVTVNLSSDLETIIELPSTVILPANETEVEILFDTQIDPNQSSDENAQILAEATGYASGFGWLLISNQNKPDAVISEITTNANPEGGSEISVTSLIKNQGNTSFPTQSKINYYLSKSKNIGNTEPFVSSIVNKAIAVDDTYEYTEELELPNISGDYYLIAEINSDYALNELDYENNQNEIFIQIYPAYSVDITLNKAVYGTNEIVEITGIAQTASDNPVPNADIALNIKNEEFGTDYSIVTDANGAFVFEYKPLENESGSYTVTAAFPGENISPQESFELLGFEIINKPQYIKWETVVATPLGKEFTLKNKTKTTLTGVEILVPEDANFSINQTPIDIEAGETVVFQYEVVPNLASEELKYTEFKMVIQSNEGAQYSEQGYYYCKNQEAKLVVSPISINTTMVKGQTRLYEVTVKNEGAINAEQVEVLLPEMDWLKLNSQKIIETIQPDEEIKIVLEFEPTVKEQVNVPITGNFVITQKVGNSVSVPFRLETVSESTGKLIIDAVDEYTFNTVSAPHLKDAKVSVKHPFTGEIIAEGLTNELGLFEVPVINEGWYVVNITADNHNPYQNNILVDPGKDTFVKAFLQYKAVTYSWDVTETEILDEYDIVLNVDFETNVPLPVVVMTLDNPNLDLNLGESRMTYITVTNHGLIAVEKINLSVGNADGYTIKPLIESLDVLNAKSTITVPVLVKHDGSSGKASGAKNSLLSTNSGGGCNAPVNLTGIYICDGEKNTSAATSYVRTCPSNGSSDGPAIYSCIGCGGPGGPGGGPGGGGGYGPGGGSATLTSFPDFCDPCIQKTVETTLKCASTFSGSKTVKNIANGASCAFGFLTATSMSDYRDKALGCLGLPAVPKNAGDAVGAIIDKIPVLSEIKGAWDCGWGIGSIINDCFISKIVSKDTNKKLNSKNSNESSDGVFALIAEDFDKINSASEAHANMISEYINNPELEDNLNIDVFLILIANHVDEQKVFTSTDIIDLKNFLQETTISDTDVDAFTTRWNSTVQAWNSSVFSPNVTYPNIVDKVKIDNYYKIKADLEVYAFTRGFVSVADMYNSDLEFINEYVEEKSQDEASVCATVSIEFPQRLTMTRQAFEGTLKINNSSDKAISEINLELIVKDENGENKTHLFQINKEDFLNGNGIVDPEGNGQGLALFIPTKEAAPEVPKSYSFGGILSYFDPDLGETVSITLNPVTLEVNPSPDLILHYFMQRDILGDDSLTEDIIEPSIPAELSLMIVNDGYGLAKSVNVESMQPKIVENEKGLLIDFEMIGSNFNNEPTQLGLLNVDFGDIEAKTAAVGQWFFTSSLIGHFVEYNVKVNHTSSFGNENLSLIKGAYIHELVRSVKSYGNDSDDIADFLVNNISDVYDTPDMLYLSDGTSEDVSKAEAIEIVEEITSATLTSKIKLTPITTGWNYENILNPAAKQYKISRVVRDSDGFEIPLENFWQTNVTLKDGLNPKYETKLHVLDKITDIETYTLYFDPIDGNIPNVVSFIDAPEPYNTEPIEFVTVEFNKEIDLDTFTNEDIEIIHQGASIATDDVIIGKINDTTFSINISALTEESGFYELTVNTIGIKDLLGNNGLNGKKTDWVQFNNELGILVFETDQLKKNPINTVNIIFNKPIRTEEFTVDKITINGQPANNLTIEKIDDYNYSISGINALNEDNGDYTIAIDVTKIKATDGVPGLAIQTHDWVIDNNIPKVVMIKTSSQGAINNQFVTQLDIELNRKLVSDLEASAFLFTKNGQEITIPIIIQKNDDLNYTIFGLDGFTNDNGTYRVTIDQSSFTDENDNSGEGIADASWTVRLDPLDAISNLKITPDKGISDSDNITSGDDIQLIYETLVDDVTVEVYELLGTSEVLINEQYRALSGEYSIPLVNQIGAKRFKVVAQDAFGNRSDAVILSAYIDFTDILTDIQSVNEVTNDCTDFDYIEVNFSEDITENSFSLDAITLKSKDIIIPKNNVIINKIDDRNFTLENIENPTDGSIVLEIDKTKITKNLSGISGFITESIEIGSPTEYPVNIIGEESPILNEIYEYTTDVDMNKYDWIIINGEIISTEGNKVTLKWTKTDEQSLILRYQTPLNCTLTTTLEAFVFYETLSDDDVKTEKGKNLITPVPNNGQFTIHTNLILNDCTLSVFDVTGKMVHKENHVNLSNKVKNINLGLNSGTYFLILQNSEEKLHFKFLVN